jgi:hypothetical protein
MEQAPVEGSSRVPTPRRTRVRKAPDLLRTTFNGGEDSGPGDPCPLPCRAQNAKINQVLPVDLAKNADISNVPWGERAHLNGSAAKIPAPLPDTAVSSSISVNDDTKDDFLLSKLKLKDFGLKIKSRMRHVLNWAQVVFITSSMAVSETTNKLVLVVCAFSIISGVIQDLHLYYSVWLAVFAGILCASFLIATIYFTWQVEDMERIAAKYGAADDFLELKKLQSQEGVAAVSAGPSGMSHLQIGDQLPVPPLGPVTKSAENLCQGNSEASNIKWLLNEAARLSIPFEEKVLCVLHGVLLEHGGTTEYPTPTFNLKGGDRAYEKALNDYKKNFRLLKDMLRGSIVCKNLTELRRVWCKMEQLENSGVLRILQIKNRFRGSPFPTGYRDLNCNVEFEGFICEVQLHCHAHYILKEEQHKVYTLCRSLDLMGKIDDERYKSRTVGELTVRPSLGRRVVVSTLRAWSGFLVINWGWLHARCGLCSDVYHIYDDGFTGYLLVWKTLSLCFPLWIVGGMLLGDMWKDGKGGFFFAFFSTSFTMVVFTGAVSQDMPTVSISWAMPVLYFIVMQLSAHRRNNGAAEVNISRVALLYRQYFGIDGTHFAWKSASIQCISVFLQAQAKLQAISMVVTDEVAEGWYWLFFGVLLLNCVVPPLLLSSKRPWFRQEGAMCFDISCDLLYVLGFVIFMWLHQVNMPAVVPTDVLSFSSNLFPMLRILSISRVLLQQGLRAIATESTSISDELETGHNAAPPPSKLPPKAAGCFAVVSLMMLGAVVFSEQSGYPFNNNPCRPWCSCSVGRVLEHCEYDGSQLHLNSRGITRVMPGALKEEYLPHLKYFDLALNAITVLETGTFTDLPKLTELRVFGNRVNTSSWFWETCFPILRATIPTESGLSLIQPGVFANHSQLETLSLGYNSFSSTEALGGICTALPKLKMADGLCGLDAADGNGAMMGCNEP